ncbi:MAG: THUMP domain-containing protein, partial [Candidatus Woesearchaeota archaeon]|nr:THUMP domain-containing protein [Candidatus Woesearchaeota archaeon]
MALKFFGVTHKGMEDIGAAEVKQILGMNAEILSEAVTFNATLEKGCEFAYKTQSMRTVLLCLSEGAVDVDDVASYAKIVPAVKQYLTSDKTFKVECDKDTSEITSQEINDVCGAVIKEQTGSAVNYKTPEVIFSLFIRNEKAWFGIDICGFDLSKRPYRVFLGTNSLKGTIAYGITQIAGYTPKKTLLDPFCRHGIIPIEAGLFALQLSPHYYTKEKYVFARIWPELKEKFVVWDKIQASEHKSILAMHDQFTFVAAAKKNAQLAGINKEIDFSRADIDWLDIKFEEGSIDCLVGYPPQHAHSPEKCLKLMN